MSGYTKLFGSIITSTIWRESPIVCKVWVTMLALADRDGIAEGTIPGLAHLAGVTIEETEHAVAKFLAPDRYSRSTENEGRRIEPVDGGWRLLNHDKYQYKLSKEDKRERDRLRQERHRARQRTICHAATVTERDNCDNHTPSHEIAHAPKDPSVSAINQNLSSNADASDDSDWTNALKDVWDYYIVQVGKNPKTYSFTKLRKLKGLARLKECVAKTETLADAVALMKTAADGLVKSDWHMGRDAKTYGKKYCDWDSHLFGSYERMEQWWNQ